MTLMSAINVSEGRDEAWLADYDEFALVVDRHTDPEHHRSVITIGGEFDEIIDTAIAVAARAIDHIDLRDHHGLHPRLGAVDVVPFVALGSATTNDCVAARQRFAERLAQEFDVPSFFYGPLSDGSIRALPELRRDAFGAIEPDVGPKTAHPSAGACAVGVRGPLVAWNLLVSGIDLSTGKAIAKAVRSTQLRAIALPLEQGVQISCNLIDPIVVTPADAFDAITAKFDWRAHVVKAELVGTIPQASLDRIDPTRWESLDLTQDKTVESRLAARGIAIN
jgi:glutamate formiminotransferase